MQAVKPHAKPITKVSCNPRGTILVTGSEDKTIFIFQIVGNGQLVQLEPIGYIELGSAITYITWKPNYVRPNFILSANDFMSLNSTKYNQDKLKTTLNIIFIL